MNDLESNINDILQEKTLKILPENIKEGIKIFGISGSCTPLDLQEYAINLSICKRILEGIKKPITESLKCYYYGNNLIDKSNMGANGSLTGSYITTNTDYIEFTGGSGQTGAINNARGTFEVYCNIPTTFSPYTGNAAWFHCSCIFGWETGGAQQDFGIIIDNSGYFAIGYSMSSVMTTGIKANDGQDHHLLLTVTDTTLKLYIDGILRAEVDCAMAGTIATNYGLFWNLANSSSIIQGKLYTFRYYDRILEDIEIQQNYECCVNKIY